MKICFTGDLFLGGDLLNKHCKNIVSSNVFNSADVRIVNLEQPISDTPYIEDKCTLYTGSYALKQLNELKINAVNLAHNHIQDKGLEAIEETIHHLNSVGIGHYGAGKNILKAQEPYWITDSLCILGYCEFDKPYLRQIVVATPEKPGINPLRLAKIKADLNNLEVGKKAILYFHWGMEHVWLPPAEDIALAKTLLEDARVVTIIGMHAHRIQGIVKHANKKAYMCLGNFIFPNFHIKPPVQIFYPTEDEKKKVKYTTRQYLAVFKPTYKKWRWVNRVSLILDFCTKSNQIRHVFVVQNDNLPEVKELKGVGLYFYKFWLVFLTLTYKLPPPIYSRLWKMHTFEVKLAWRLQILWFYLKQLGIKGFSKKGLQYVRKKLKK
jgi:poly-gamma-glutamate synthesis protein (capsule biosynthesis protein)